MWQMAQAWLLHLLDEAGEQGPVRLVATGIGLTILAMSEWFDLRRRGWK